ncbi:MAG: hypothetical protein K0R02_282 [Rickettsiaceae bacterium]|jgi:hypothetical protein|nr:hypothetical protein [Rickettsiaceae bacterium]
MRSNNLKFTFVSLNLFILIFFILLTSNAALNSNVFPLQDIFRSFRGESLSGEPLIVLSAEEQKFIKAKQYFKSKLDILFSDKSPELVDTLKENSLYILNFDIKEILAKDKDSAKYFSELLEAILNVNEDAYGYYLSIDFFMNDKDLLNQVFNLNDLDKLLSNALSQEGVQKITNIKFEDIAEPGTVKVRINLAVQ